MLGPFLRTCDYVYLLDLHIPSPKLPNLLLAVEVQNVVDPLDCHFFVLLPDPEQYPHYSLVTYATHRKEEKFTLQEWWGKLASGRILFLLHTLEHKFSSTRNSFNQDTIGNWLHFVELLRIKTGQGDVWCFLLNYPATVGIPLTEKILVQQPRNSLSVLARRHYALFKNHTPTLASLIVHCPVVFLPIPLSLENFLENLPLVTFFPKGGPLPEVKMETKEGKKKPPRKCANVLARIRLIHSQARAQAENPDDLSFLSSVIEHCSACCKELFV